MQDFQYPPLGAVEGLGQVFFKVPAESRVQIAGIEQYYTALFCHGLRVRSCICRGAHP